MLILNQQSIKKSLKTYLTPIFLALVISLCFLNSFANNTNFKKDFRGQEDFIDCLLLSNSNITYNTDINFKYISKFYGLSFVELNLETVPLNDSLLRNQDGNYIKSICIAYNNLSDTNILDTKEVHSIEMAVENGSNLIITEINDSCSLNNLKIITDSQFIATNYTINEEGWYFTNKNDSITSTFTNDKITDDTFKKVYNLQATNNVDLIVDISQLIIAFSYIPAGRGKIFLDGNIQDKNIDEYRMYDLYNSKNLNNILPIMMFLKYSTNGSSPFFSVKFIESLIPYLIYTRPSFFAVLP